MTTKPTGVAVVTAAGKGIGAACARELARRGYRLALLSSGGGARRLAAELGGVAVDGSVANAGDLQRLVSTAIDAYGRIDAVVNNTGHPAKGPVLELTDEQWREGLDLLLLNVVRMARLVTPIMLNGDAPGGSIVNISTASALEPDPAFPVSVTMRAALASFTKLYASAHAASGIRMNNVLPGFVDNHPVDEARRHEIPMNRPGTPEEIARTVAFLLSEDAAYITGQSLRVDGGLTRSV